MKQKTTTTLDNNTLAVVHVLSNSDAGKLFKAVARYATEGIEESFTEGEIRILFALFKQQIDFDNAKYEKTSETNSSNAKGRNRNTSAVVAKSRKGKKTVTDGDAENVNDIIETAEESADDEEGQNGNDGSEPYDGKPPESGNQASYSSADKATAGNEAFAKGEQNENLSFEYLESLYPRKDATGAYRHESETVWNGMTDESRRKAIAFVQDNASNGTSSLSDMFLSQFLKRQQWLAE